MLMRVPVVEAGRERLGEADLLVGHTRFAALDARFKGPTVLRASLLSNGIANADRPRQPPTPTET